MTSRARLPRSVTHRLAFLLVGNVALLWIIGMLLKQGGSFGLVLRRIGPDLAPVILAGLGLTGIIFTGAIDLSIASIIAIAGSIFGILVQHRAAPLAAYAGCVITAWALSALNGRLVGLFQVPAIILTLAGLPFYRGLALILADLGIPKFAGNISIQDEAYHAPGKSFPGSILVFVLVIALIWEAYARTPRRWLALGSSEEACRLAGMDPRQTSLSAFFVGGLFLGLAALLYVSRVQAIEPSRIALGFELQVIGAVVLGGTNIFGGEGTYLGTVLGALFLYLISEALTYAGASPYSHEAIVGAVIVIVIGIDCALHRKRKLMEELS